MEEIKKDTIEEIISKKIEEKDLGDNLFDDLTEEDFKGKDSKQSEESIVEDVEAVEENLKEIVKEENLTPVSGDTSDPKLVEHINNIVASPDYPISYPGVSELLKMKEEHKEFFIVKLGGVVEQLAFDTEVRVFICTTFKPHMLESFSKSEIDDGEFNNFIVEQCVLHPKVSREEVRTMSVGEYYQLLQTIKSKSYLNSSASIIKV